MNNLPNIYEHKNQKLVSARELHEFLESKRDFSNWIKNRIDKYGFVYGQDFTSFNKIVERENGAAVRIEYALTIDMAKELSMVENNDRGKEARRYFIQKEKEAINNFGLISPTRKQLAEWVLQQEEELEKLRKENKSLTPKAELMDKVLDTDTNIDIGQVAKILELPFGRNTLFKKLREKRVFFKGKNEPIQEYIERGYFKLKEKLIERNNHENFTVIKILVTQKGLEFIAKLFQAEPSSKSLAKIS